MIHKRTLFHYKQKKCYSSLIFFHLILDAQDFFSTSLPPVSGLSPDFLKPSLSQVAGLVCRLLGGAGTKVGELKPEKGHSGVGSRVGRMLGQGQVRARGE